LFDFGIAKDLNQSTITIPGTLNSTPDYAPPELLRGEEPDGRSDLFSLASLVYEMLTGRLPYGNVEGDYRSSRLRYEVEDRVPDHPTDLNPDVPVKVGDALMKARATNRLTRFEPADESADELRNGIS